MHHARSVVTVLLIVVSLAGATTAIEAEDTSPPSVTSHEVNVVRQVAIALAAGSDAIKELRGPRLRILTWTGSIFPRPEWIAALLETSSMSHATAFCATRRKPRLCSPGSLMMCRLP